MSDVTEMMVQYQAHAKALAEAIKTNKATTFAALAVASITLVTVTFDGGGDSGQIQEVVARAGDATAQIPDTEIEMQRASWSTGKLDSARIALRDAIEKICFDYLSQEHGGWENNDGAFGEFSFSVEEREIELEFHDRYTATLTENHTF